MGRYLLSLLALLLAGSTGFAQTKHLGTNSPGGIARFQFQVTTAITNFSLTLPGTSRGYSHLYLKKGQPAGETNYDFRSILAAQTNSINLEVPQVAPSTWHVSVITPTNAPTNAFTLTRQMNVAALRKLRPVNKPMVFTTTGIVARTNWNFFRIEVPENPSPLTISLQSTNMAPDVYIQREGLPTIFSYLKRSIGATNDLIQLADAELLPGSYVIGVYSSSINIKYTLRSSVLNIIPLTFDPGTNNFGTFAFSNFTAKATNFYFKVRTESPDVGAWRTVLNVFEGEANLYASRGKIPATNAAEFRFEKRGSDGFVYGTGQFTPGQDWYFLVTTRTNTRWSIVSGAAYVKDFGELAAEKTVSTNVIGAEGWSFFKTSIPADTLAWRLRLDGATNIIYLKKTSVPLAIYNGSELNQQSQILVVPPYLVAGQQYFVGVPGVPGTVLNLESMQQPIVDIDFTSSTNIAANAHGYTTFRVQVPPSEIAWQINAIPGHGAPDLYVRRNMVPSEKYNDAYSEAPGSVTDSVTLVPPSLSDATFFVTVAATNTNSFRLQSGPPTITYIQFSDLATNLETNRVGWRYFCVTNIEEQVGALGWDLLATNAPTGTKIAVRRNQVPSAWSYRNGTSYGNSRSYNVISASNYLQLQRPTYQADVWYVGVYNPLTPLSGFTLISRPLTATLLNGDGGNIRRTNAAPYKWEYFRVDVPPDVDGWDVRLTNVSGGMPKITIRREDLPQNDVLDLVVSTNTRSTLSSAALATNWPGGMQWTVTKDWTQREFGPAKGNVSQWGRVFAAGMRRPLEPATYYIGVYNASSTRSSYTVMSRFIGTNRAIALKPLPFSGGTATNTLLAPREAHYYRVNVPAESRSLKIKLTVTAGEAMLVASTNKVPNIESEKRVQKLKDEHFLLLPDKGQSYLRAGDHFLAVISEGANPTNNRVSSGAATYKLQTFGEMPEPMKGTLGPEGLSWSDSLQGGESKVYHFTVPSGVPGFYTIMNNRVGHPVKVGIAGMVLPDPGAADDGFGADPYGNLGGENDTRAIAVSAHRILFSGNGTATLMVKSRSVNGTYKNASYSLALQRINPELVSFDNGKRIVAKQTNAWNFFRVDVPANAVGWDIRLTNVVSGSPKLVVARNWIPNHPDTFAFNPATSTNWPSGHRWAASRDWTERAQTADGTKSEDGRILAMGMGRPLEPGTYYVGVYSSSPTEYTLLSRGIGSGFAVPVRTLSFANDSFTLTNLPPREAAYFRVTVPPGMPSWKVKLETINSEAAMLVLRSSLPSVLGSTSMSSTNPASPGRKMQKIGNENFLLLPPAGQSSLAAGDYYIAVASEGKKATNVSRIGVGPSSFKLTSVGPLPMIDLGTLTTNLLHTNAISAGEVVGYQFAVPPGTVSVEAQLQNRVGNPVLVMRPGTRLPDPGVSLPVIGSDLYGNEGGETANNAGSATVATLANPTNGIYTILVKARPTNSIPTNAQFTLRLSATASTALAFDGGSVSVTNQSHGSWRYYRVDIPENALGWDVRLTNVSSGLPRIVVRRDALPSGINTTPWGSPGSQSSWPSSNQWAAAGDWTRRQYSPNGATDENYRILAMGAGRPLEPGSYYVGIAGGPANSSPMSYTLVSRGIGDGFSIPVVDLDFNGGSATNLALPAREAAYFRVVVPENTASWKMKVTGLSGEFMMVGLKDSIPNVDYIDSARSTAFGKTMQKAGNEHFAMLPASGQTNIPAVTNYFAVVSEGTATNAQRIGAGNSSFAITSIGQLAVTNLGTVSVAAIEHSDALEGGELKAYQFTVPENAGAIEVKLENRVGNPVMALRFTNSLPDPGSTGFGLSNDPYGNEGGHPVNDQNPFLLTVPNAAPGVYSLVVKARATANGFTDASYRIRIRQLPVQDLGFGPLNTNGFTNVVSGLLETNQRTFFKVEIPAPTEGSSILGWKLELRHQSGSASVRVRRDLLPSDSFTASPPFSSPAAYIVPPYFTNGTWYVEVKGMNTTEFMLTSSPIELARPTWEMPTVGSTNVAPGLVHPVFADTAVSTNGAALGGDGVYLEQGFQHFYGIVVPQENLGLLRLQLEAISGNPDLFGRTNHLPTLNHSASGSSGRLVEREMKATTGTEYGNWVPIDGKTETGLRPGLWFFGVQAAGNANARYRLRLSVGNIQDVPTGTMMTNQTVVGGDWRHYRFHMPATATNWTITFSQTSGDVWLYLREVIPPGNGSTGTEYKHWATDAKGTGPFPDFNAPGTYTIGFPPAKKDVLYYLGFRALNDASFSFRVNIAESTPAFAPIAADPMATGTGEALASTASPPLNLVSPRITPDGHFHADLSGAANRNYTIEVSDDLTHWTPLTTVSNASGAVKISDTVKALRESRFYRIRME